MLRVYVLLTLNKIVDKKLQSFLTLFGIAIATMILSGGLIFSDSYYYSEFNRYEMYETHNLVTVSPIANDELVRDLQTNLEREPALYSKVNTRKLGSEDLHNGTLQLSSDIYTVSSHVDVIVPTGESGDTYYNPTLIEGRTFNESDYVNKNSVVMVDELTAALLFEEEALGESIEFQYPQFDASGNRLPTKEVSLEIIGVYETSYYTVGAYHDAKEKLKNGESDFEDVSLNLFIPNSSIIPVDTTDAYTQAVFTDVSSMETFLTDFYETFNTDIVLGDLEINTFGTLANQLQNDLQSFRQQIHVLVIGVGIVSALGIMNTLFFSIKERAREIGIRKAVGASKEAILSQFMVEGIFYGMFGAILGLLLGMIIALIGILYFKGMGSYNLELVLKGDSIMLILLFPLLVTFISSVFPAYYASSIKIADTLRLD